MKIEFAARHTDLDDNLREMAEERLTRATRRLREPVEIRVALEAGAGDKRLVAVDVHVNHPGNGRHTRAEGVDLRETVLEAISGIESQVRRRREKSADKRRRANRDAASQRQWPVDVLARESLQVGQAPRIVRSSRLSIKPMTIDEAALKLESSRNEFVVFVDSENERVSVLYKRKDENYGLISPEL